MTQSKKTIRFSQNLLDLEKYIPFPCTFNNRFNTLIIKANGKSIRIAYDTITQLNHESYDCKNLEEAKIFIAFKILTKILSKAYGEIYKDFTHLSFETFSSQRSSENTLDYQAMYQSMLNYFKLMDCIQENDTTIATYQISEDHSLCGINAQLKEIGITFKEFMLDTHQNSMAQVDHLMLITQGLRTIATTQRTENQATQSSMISKFKIDAPVSASYFSHDNMQHQSAGLRNN